MLQKPRELPAAELRTADLLYRANDPDPARARWFLVEFHKRLALPTACLVLALVGIPLGLSSKKGGKSTGFVLTIILVFIYYLISLTGVALARQGRLPAIVGVWMPNLVFAIAGVLLLRQVDRSSLEIGSVRHAVKILLGRFQIHREVFEERRAPIRLQRDQPGNSRSPLILDNYVVRMFLTYLGLVLASFMVLTLVFTMFELIGDIVRNRSPLITVAAYLANVLPQMIDTTMPLSSLISVLVTFSLLQYSNELTAMKATGISIYRVITPVLVVALLLSIGLFFFEQTYLPQANTRQEALRNSIKGKPPQTILRPDRKWIFGEHNVIYYYEHFDTDQNEFAGFSAFEFDPQSFAITRRIYAARAHWGNDLKKWVLEQGWVREFQGNQVNSFRTFDVTAIAEISEQPAYFKKEVKQSSEMSYRELDRYVKELEQSGFDVVRLRVQLQKKIAFPLVVFVMAVMAVPFAISAGHRGALTGVAVALGLALVYWVTNGLFEALGNVSQLPPALAAWAPNLLFGLIGGYLLFKIRT